MPLMVVCTFNICINQVFHDGAEIKTFSGAF